MAKKPEQPQFIDLEGRRLVRKSARTLRKKAEWHGGIVRAKVRIQSGQGTLPPGSCYQVMRNYAGLGLLSLPCRCCGIRVHVGKVAESDVDYVGHVQVDDRIIHWYEAEHMVDNWRINKAKDTRAGGQANGEGQGTRDSSNALDGRLKERE